jgi:hypothetical protein
MEKQNELQEIGQPTREDTMKAKVGKKKAGQVTVTFANAPACTPKGRRGQGDGHFFKGIG